MSKLHILIVDDEPDIRQVIQVILEEEGYLVSAADSGASARKMIANSSPDLILLDIWMPDEDGISLLKDGLESGQIRCPVLMMSGHATVETAIEATRLGAHDLLEKPISMAKLLVSVAHALASRPLQQEPAGGRRRIETYIEPVGRSAIMERLREQAKRLAQHEASILLVGEAGTGKETLARYIHGLSPRREAPFLELNVNAVEPEFILAELLGQETGGVIYPGLLELAKGGTLLIDEVTDLEIETQIRLSSILESSSYSRLGGTELIPVDLHVVATTQRSPEDEVRLGHMRAELLYQLNAVTLRLPGLREHAEDIPELLRFHVDFLATRENLPFRRFPVSVQNFLRNYTWPGNIRELNNLVHRLLILGTTEDVTLDEVKSALGENKSVYVNEARTDFFELPLKEARERFEKAYLEYHLEKFNGSVARLSQAIHLERTHLYRKLNSLGIKFKDKR